jgi:hypothetical protein
VEQQGEEIREYAKYILPHAEFGDPECCGLFFGVERDGLSDITCKECEFVIKTVLLADLFMAN